MQKRDFHKKVLLSIKEFNKKEYIYKEEIKTLRTELSHINLMDYNNKLTNLKQKKQFNESQLRKYEEELINLNNKYEDMLSTKKLEINRYVDLIQIEKNKNLKLEKQIEELLEEKNLLKKLVKKLEKNNK